MEIDFENGSKIEAIPSGDSIRGSRDNYIFPNSNTFLFDWKDLNGKTLKIRVAEDSGVVTVGGYDEAEDKIYILHSGDN